MQPIAIRAPEAQRRRFRKILSAGTALFEKNGFSRTTMDDIAHDVGITKRTLYRYVSSKQEFLLKVHEQFLDAAESLQASDDQVSSATAQLDTFVRSYITAVVRHQRAVRVFFEEEYNLTDEARASVIARRDEFEARLRELLASGQGDGEFRDVDVRVVSAGILGALAGIYQWYKPHGPLSLDAVTENLTSFVLDGLSTDRSDEKSDEPLSFAALAKDDAAVAAPRYPPQFIMDVAARLFAKHGYAETNTREIADAAGITKSALFYHIGSKEALLYAIEHQFGMSSLSNLDGWRSEHTNPVEALRSLIVNHARTMGDQRDWVRVFNESVRYLSRDRRRHIERLRSRYVDGIAEIIDLGVERGALRAADSRVAALTILGMLNWMARWFDPQGRLEAVAVGEQFARLAIDGVLAREAQD